MKHTTNLNLNKPEATDYVNIEDLNENADIIDEEIHDTKHELENLQQDFDKHKTDEANPHKVTVGQIGAIPLSEKGAPGGVATLDSQGGVPFPQLKNIPISIEGFTFNQDYAPIHVGTYDGFRVHPSEGQRTATLRIDFDGRIRIRFNLSRLNTSITGNYNLSKNNTILASGGSGDFGTSSGTTHYVSTDIKKGDILKLKIYNVNHPDPGVGSVLRLQSLDVFTSLVTFLGV